MGALPSWRTYLAPPKSGRTPLELEALLLLQFPLLLTLAKFADDTTSRNHQFARSKTAPLGL
jgi:hypothetical protein